MRSLDARRVLRLDMRLKSAGYEGLCVTSWWVVVVIHFPDIIFTLMERDNWRCPTNLGYESLERSRL